MHVYCVALVMSPRHMSYMPSSPSLRAPCIRARLRPLATKPYEISGLEHCCRQKYNTASFFSRIQQFFFIFLTFLNNSCICTYLSLMIAGCGRLFFPHHMNPIDADNSVVLSISKTFIYWKYAAASLFHAG